MSLYQELKDAGIETDSHESDLYFRSTVEAMEILNRYQKDRITWSTFYNDGVLWVDVPFMFEPWWEARRA